MESKVSIFPNRIVIVFGVTLSIALLFSMLMFPQVWTAGLYTGIGLVATGGVIRLIAAGFMLYHKVKMMQLERLKEAHLIVAANSYVFNTQSHEIYTRLLQSDNAIDAEFTPIDSYDNVLSLVNTAFHFLLVGDTGSGKSTLARLIIHQLNADTLILDPHATLNEWPAAAKVARDYSSIGIALERTLALMDSRYAKGERGEMVCLAIDETPAVIDELKELGYDAGRIIRRLSREGRKVNICLILMSQGENVGDLGQKGYSSVKHNFVKVLLNRQDTLQSRCKVEFANGDTQIYRLPNPLDSVNSGKPKILQLSSGVKCANPECNNMAAPGSKYCKENYNACKQAVYRLSKE